MRNKSSVNTFDKIFLDNLLVIFLTISYNLQASLFIVYKKQQQIPKTHRYFYFAPLTLIWVGFLEVCFRLGGVILPLMSKLVRIRLETSNLVHKCTSTHTYGKYTF